MMRGAFVAFVRDKLSVYTGFASLCVLLVSINATGQSTKLQTHKPNGKAAALQLDTDQPYVPVHTDSHPCGYGDLKFLELPSTRALLADYGYEVRPPMTCQAAAVPWVPSAKIIRLKESLDLDDYREFTLLQGSSSSRLWLVPIEFGMVGYPHTADSPHHIAAFNDLLRYASHKPDENMLLELGNLYQFIVGSEEWFDPARTPKTVQQALTVNDIQAMTEHDANGLTYKHREFDGDAWTHSYMVWEFYFTNSQHGLRLTNVERGPLDPNTDDIKEN
jgi:hypothetical protein